MAEVEIKVVAEVAQANAELKKLDQSLESMGKAGKGAGLSITDLKSALDIGIGAFKAAAAAVKAVIDPVIDYAKEVRDLGRTIGATAEESSKLIQAADDVGISAGTLQAALQAAIRKGVEPTIEGISQLAEEYLAIEDPIERTAFLMENFGRSGAALAPLMEQGAAGIKAAGDAAEATGLVMSGEAVQAARDYEIAIDNLDDSLMSLKIAATDVALPAIIGLADGMTAQISLTKTWDEAQKLGIVTAEDWTSTHHALSAGLLTTNGIIAQLTTEIDNYHQGLVEVDPAVQNMRLANDDLTGAAERATVAIQSQDQWLADLASVTTTETIPATYELLTATDLLSAGLSGLTEQMVFNRAAAGLSAEAALQLGIDMGIVDTRVLALNVAIPALQEKYGMLADGTFESAGAAAAYAAAVQALTDALLAIPSHVESTVTTNFVNNGSQYGGPAGPPQQPIPQASGGDWLVHKPTLFMAGEAGSERVTFTPTSNVTNNYNVNANYANQAEGSVADELALMSKLYG